MTNHKSLERLRAQTAEQVALLSELHLLLVARFVSILSVPVRITVLSEDGLFTSQWASRFAESLLLHHVSSNEEFKKEHFEHAFLRASNLCSPGRVTKPTSRTNPYDLHDSALGKLSLKTHASADIKEDRVFISKFMELGGGEWQLDALRARFLAHLSNYDRVLIFRALRPGSSDKIYELLELPMSLLRTAETGVLEWSVKSRTVPRTGYCHVPDKEKSILKLKFDGGSEQKLTVTGLDKAHCTVLATWRFSLPP